MGYMTCDELSLSAANGTLPENMSAAERAAWYPLRDLYSAVREGRMMAFDAGREKAKLMERYDRDVMRERDGEKARQYNADLYKRIEQKAIAYAKAEVHTPEADDFFEAVYGMRPGMRREIE